MSDEEEKDIDDVVLVPDDKYSAQSLDKMITLVAVLVEKSRIDRQLHLSVRDTQALIGGGKVRSVTCSINQSISLFGKSRLPVRQVFIELAAHGHINTVTPQL